MTAISKMIHQQFSHQITFSQLTATMKLTQSPDTCAHVGFPVYIAKE